MVSSSPAGQAQWSSKAAFILAATGSAVGLGNLWRFPTEAGTNGGGAFVLLYILCVVLIALPLLLAESLIGRHGQRSTIGSAVHLARQSGASPAWSLLAIVGLIANTAILTFYGVVAGWVIYFVGTSAADLAGAIGAGDPLRGAYAEQSVAQIQEMMPTLFANPVLLVGLQLAFVVLTVWIVARGVKGGIEAAATWLMPAFFFLLIGITVYAAIIGDFAAALTFLFTPDFERALQPGVLSAALGQAFFSLSLGGGAMIAYGAYASRETNLGQTSGMIAFADTGVAIIAGLAIFPIVFFVGMEPNAGPTLMFQTLPAAFNAMPGGAIVRLCDALDTAPDSPLRRYTPDGADIDSVIDLRAVFQPHHRDMDLSVLPRLLAPPRGRFGLTDYEKAFCPDLKAGPDIFDRRGIDRDTGALVVVRPDQFTAAILPLGDHAGLTAFFARFMIPQH